MEPRFEQRFDDVRVHADERASSLSREIGAQAFTSDRDIFFRQGAFRPATGAGRRLIAHELAHVAQQRGSTGQNRIVQRQPAEDAMSEDPANRFADLAALGGTRLARRVADGEVSPEEAGQALVSLPRPAMLAAAEEFRLALEQEPLVVVSVMQGLRVAESLLGIQPERPAPNPRRAKAPRAEDRAPGPKQQPLEPVQSPVPEPMESKASEDLMSVPPAEAQPEGPLQSDVPVEAFHLPGPTGSILAQELLAGERSVADLLAHLRTLTPRDHQVRAREILTALDAEDLTDSPLTSLPMELLHDARRRLDQAAQREVEALRSATLRAAVKAGFLPGGVTDEGWSSLKNLLASQYGFSVADFEKYWETHIKTGPAFGRNVTAHEAMLAGLAGASSMYEQLTGEKEIGIPVQSLAVRPVRGNSGKLSLHSFGLAIDIAPAQNPMFKGKELAALKEVVRILGEDLDRHELFEQNLLAEQSEDAAGSEALLAAAEELLASSRRIEGILNDDPAIEQQVLRIVREAGEIRASNAEEETTKLLTEQGDVRARVQTYLGRVLGPGAFSEAQRAIVTLVQMRAKIRATKRPFFLLSLSPPLVVSLMKGGNLLWLGATHEPKDFMHFEVKGAKALIK